MSTSRIFLALLLVVALSGFVFTECMAADIIVAGGGGGGGDGADGGSGGGGSGLGTGGNGEDGSMGVGGGGGGGYVGDNSSSGLDGFTSSGGDGRIVNLNPFFGLTDIVGAAGGGGQGGNGVGGGGGQGSRFNGGSSGGGGNSAGGNGGNGGFASANTVTATAANGGSGSGTSGGGGGGGGAALQLPSGISDPSADIKIMAGSGGSGLNSYGGKGGAALLSVRYLGSLVNVNSITVQAGSGGNGLGGDGGEARMEGIIDIVAKTVTLESGSDSSDVNGGKGGRAALTASNTLTADTLTLKKNDGELRINSARITVGDLNVLGDAGARFDGNLNVDGTITFDLASANGSNALLDVNGNVNFATTATIDFTNVDPTLIIGNTPIILVEVLRATATGSGLDGATKDYISGNTKYTFTMEWNNKQYLLTVTTTPISSGGTTGGATVTITLIPDNNDSNNNVGGLSTGSGLCSSPIINSIFADPILGGARLSVEIRSGDECTLFYQWQVEQNGAWINIPGATGPDYYYAGLPTGTYTVRCIVKNAAGEMISAPVTFTVS